MAAVSTSATMMSAVTRLQVTDFTAHLRLVLNVFLFLNKTNLNLARDALVSVMLSNWSGSSRSATFSTCLHDVFGGN